MSHIIRTDPLHELVHFDPFRRAGLFAGWPKLTRWLDELPVEPAIRLDVTEDDKAYHVKADLPGVAKENIRVEIEGNQVSLSAEVKREKEEKKGTVVHSERYVGEQFRSFTLDHDIDRDKAEAKFADGVLELTLPKTFGTSPRRVAVQ